MDERMLSVAAINGLMVFRRT